MRDETDVSIANRLNILVTEVVEVIDRDTRGEW